MEFSFTQTDDDSRDYVADFAHFLQGKVKTAEQLEQRADVLGTEFAMSNGGIYHPKIMQLDFS